MSAQKKLSHLALSMASRSMLSGTMNLGEAVAQAFRFILLMMDSPLHECVQEWVGFEEDVRLNELHARNVLADDLNLAQKMKN